MAIAMRLLVAVIVVYGLAYCVAFRYRAPAANLAFFYYADAPLNDEVLSYAFLPAYELNQLVCWATGRPFVHHNLDRTPIPHEVMEQP